MTTPTIEPGLKGTLSPEYTIGQLLPCNAVLDGFNLKGRYVCEFEEWMLFEDLKKSNAK